MTTWAAAMRAAGELGRPLRLESYRLASRRFGCPPPFVDEPKFALAAFGWEINARTMAAWTIAVRGCLQTRGQS